MGVFERVLAHLDALIVSLEDLRRRHPENMSYARALVKLQQRRADVADTIGRGKEVPDGPY